jgi:AhpD family alkylhydroperoxidase
MKTIEVFDPAMCCSTGVCGPGVDPALARFAGDLEWLAGQGVSVERRNLAQQPGAFAESVPVAAALREKGEECLPLVLADGEVASEGRFPTREELVAFAAIERQVEVYSAQVEELVAIGAALASNCESCLEYHVGAARRLGVGDEEIAKAVKTARRVKETPARSILKAAERLQGASESEPIEQLPVSAANGSCCGGGEEAASGEQPSEAGSCC